MSSGVKQRGRSDGTYRCRGRPHRIRGKYHPSWRVKLAELNETENIKKIAVVKKRGQQWEDAERKWCMELVVSGEGGKETATAAD